MPNFPVPPNRLKGPLYVDAPSASDPAVVVRGAVSGQQGLVMVEDPLSGVLSALGLPVLYDQALAADANNFDINPPFDFSSYLVVTVLVKAKLNGVHTPHYGHLYVRFNNDAVVNDYAYSVRNSDNTGLVSTLGAALPTVGTTDAIMIGHAPTTDAVAANEWGIAKLKLFLPGEGNTVKNVHIENTIMTDFTSYADLNPLEMRGGGFWKGPGAITRLTIVPEFNQLKAGTRVIVIGGSI